MGPKLITAVVIDDHPFFRDGIVRGLAHSGRIQVVGEAGSGRAGVALIAEATPDVAVVDYQMPDLDGLGVIRSVVRDGLGTRIMLVSAVSDPVLVYAALEAGAAGYISKDTPRADIVAAVTDVAMGRTVVPPSLAAGLVDQIRLRKQPTGPVLSQRERQVLAGFARGLSIPQLAAELYLGPSTVKTHTQRLYEKLGVNDRAAAVAEGMRRGLLD
jgi:two-component system nitrate/nitrite response regulator NarL